MLVREIMANNVKALERNSTMQDAALAMKNNDIGAVPVVENNEVLGILTDRDLVIRGLAENRNSETTRINDVMSNGKIVFCNENDEVENAAKIMEENQVRRLVVKDENNKLSGILSMGDISLRADEKLAGEIVRKVSKH